MDKTMTASQDQPMPVSQAADESPHLYYPEEGFGALYRRVVINDFFTALLARSQVQSVAEVPLDTYGIIGAGALIFKQLGRHVSLISDDQDALRRAEALMHFNRVDDVTYVHSSLYRIPVAANAYDFTWSFDRLQALADPEAFLGELCRISKATIVIIPNAHNYGQYAHWLYHRLTGSTCEYVGPRKWMLREPVRQALQAGGMTIVEQGIIDAPWWPGFPELPNLIRRLLGRAPVDVDPTATPEANPQVILAADIPQLRRRVEGSAFIEHGRIWPAFIKLFFAHSTYLIACKPEFRQELGL